MCAKVCSAVLGSKRLEGSSLSIMGVTDKHELITHLHGRPGVLSLTLLHLLWKSHCCGAVLSVAGCRAAYPLDDSSSCDNQNTKNVSRHCRMSLGDTETHILCAEVESSSGYSKKRKVQNSTYIVCCRLCKKKRKNIFCYITACIFICFFKKDAQKTGHTCHSWGKGN